ncbi:MAG TPA: chorismate-binding protein, partial [Polyangiaceae bacterium]|nr:chorismate-binding protein [Polyangiaceae bacterium]
MTRLGADLEAAIVAARSEPRPGGLVAVSVPTTLEPEAVFAAASARKETACFWDATASDAVRHEIVAGAGEALRIETGGEGRFGVVERAARDLFGRLTVARGARGARVRPRLLGSFTFAPSREAGVPWSSPGATFVLPRVTIVARPGEARTLTLVLRGEELSRPDTAARDVADLLAPRPPVSKRQRAARVLEDGAAAFVRAVEDALVAIERDDLAKVVLARRSRVVGVPPVDSVVRGLAPAPGAVRFALGFDGATFFGASPELLASVEGDTIRTEALAGS